MSLERQNTFGWVTSVDSFLIGTGGGVFLASFIMDLLGEVEKLTRIGTLCGPILALIGALILLTDLRTRVRFYRVFFNPRSWISRGTWFITVFALFGLAYSLPAFWLSSWKTTLLGGSIGWIGAVFSVLTTLYVGFLLSAAKRISFWNTGVLPVLFFLSSLCTGVAILVLIAPFSTAILAYALHTLAIAGIVLVLMQSLVLAVFLEVASRGGVSAAESVRLLMKPVPIIEVIIIGLAIPLVLLWSYTVASTTFALTISAGALLLIGNFFLRYQILAAGVRLPVYSP